MRAAMLREWQHVCRMNPLAALAHEVCYSELLRKSSSAPYLQVHAQFEKWYISS